MTEGIDTGTYWQQLKEGNADALSALYRLHYVGLMNFGVKLVGDKDLVNDAITAVLLELWDKRLQLPVVYNVRAYLITCLHHRLLLEIRQEKKRNDTHLAAHKWLNGNEDPREVYLIRRETEHQFGRQFATAFEKLSERQQQLLRMKFEENYDYDRIAAACGITKRTAYNIIYDAIRQLKEELKGNAAVPATGSLALLGMVLALWMAEF